VQPATILILAGLAGTIAISLATLVLLWNVRSGMTRKIAMALIALLISAAALTLLSSAGIPSRFELFILGLSDTLVYWSVAVELHMILSFSRWSRLVSTGRGRIMIYLPVLASTVTLAVVGILYPSTMRVSHAMTPPFASFGPLDPMVMVTGAIYLFGSMSTLLLMLRAGAGEIRAELWAILMIIGLGLSASLGLLAVVPGISMAATYLIVSSLIGLVLGRAAWKKSVLIVPQSEERAVESPVDLLKPGATYLFLDERQQARELFVLYLKSGRPGLWVTRRPPREARDLYGLDKTPFIWLTSATVPGENCADPGEFGHLSAAISSFTREAKNYLILIEGVEYIVTMTGFPTVLKLVQYLNDRVMSTGGMLLLVMNPPAFRESEMALLKSEAAGVFEETDNPLPARGRAEAARRAGAVHGIVVPPDP